MHIDGPITQNQQVFGKTSENPRQDGDDRPPFAQTIIPIAGIGLRDVWTP